MNYYIFALQLKNWNLSKEHNCCLELHLKKSEPFQKWARKAIHKNKYRGMEQLVARRAHNPKVVGSSPAPATTSLVSH